jgi:mRNA interferase RelE/StbE
MTNVHANISTIAWTVKYFPDCPNVKKLQDRNGYRLRVGRWRIIFTRSLEIIEIEEVKPRDEHTY